MGQEEIDKYLDTIRRQSAQYEEVLESVQTEFSELVIGGGTPLFLTAINKIYINTRKITSFYQF